MKAEALVPVEEYLRTSYDPDCDYVDGEVVERNLGERDHSSAQQLIFSLGGSNGRFLYFRNSACR